MKIGDLAKRSGISASRIRFYEAQNLLPSSRRQSNRYREYGPEALTWLEIIGRAQGVGFSLEEIRAFLPPDLSAWSREAMLEAFRGKVGEIEALQQQLAQSKGHLLALIDEIENGTEGGDCGGKAMRVLAQLRQDRVGQADGEH